MTADAFDVTGRKVLVTGAGRGIGKGIARVLAEAGADVAINALTETHVVPLAAEIAEASGRTVVPVVGDITATAGAERVVAAGIEALGAIDVLVNGLGDSLRKSLVGLPGSENAGAPISDADLDFVLDINLREALLCTRAVGPHMLARGSGKIINVSSWTGKQGGGEMVLYTAAKAALDGFTRAQALEWAPHGIQVNGIAPGLFPDAATVGEDGVQRTEERALRLVPLARPGRLEECGYLTLYLAFAASDYMTGQTLTLDGGMSL